MKSDKIMTNSNSQTIDGQTTFYSPIDFDVLVSPREFSMLALKICSCLVCSFSLPSETVTKITTFTIFISGMPLFYEPAFDNFSSTMLVVFLKLLLFPASFLSAIEKINNKNIVHFKYLPSFLSLTFRHIHSKKLLWTDAPQLQPIHLPEFALFKFFTVLFNSTIRGLRKNPFSSF